MSTGSNTISGILDGITAGIGASTGLARQIPRVAHSDWREEVYVVYYVGKGKFSSPPDFVWDPVHNHFDFYINLLMDGYDILTGKWVGYQQGVHHSLATVDDFLTVPPPPQGDLTIRLARCRRLR